MFESLDATVVARLQFAFTIGFHIVFPSLTIGLASYLAVLEAMWLKTRDDTYIRLFDYWKKIFAVAFGMGVVSGVVMSYQFGTNWSVFADRTGPVLGPLMAYEVLTAFFLEAGFLGVMLFGRARVGPGLHFAATVLVAVGTLLSAFWILSANSWMHTPAGYAVNADGQFTPADWLAVIFNPSFPYRLVHMVLAAYLTTALVVGATAAWQLLRGRDFPAVRTMFSMAMWMLALTAPVQIVAGDLHGLNTLEHQPAKIAAMEGHFETRTGAPLYLFGIPDMEAETVRHAVEIPKLGSLILTHDAEGEVAGLKQWPPDQRPNAEILFWTFRVMVGLGFLMLALGAGGLYLRWRGRLYRSRWLHRAALAMGPSGFVALLSGWITTEVGRQPWTVYGLLRTADAVSPVAAPGVGASLVAFVCVYLLVFGAGTYYLLRMMAKPPERAADERESGPLHAAAMSPFREDARPGTGGAA